MAYEVTITKKDGSQIKYNLMSSSELKFVDKNRKVLLFFDSGEIYKGFTDGGIDEDSDLSVRENIDDKFCACLPFDRLLGWAYESAGRQKQSPWQRLRKYWNQIMCDTSKKEDKEVQKNYPVIKEEEIEL